METEKTREYYESLDKRTKEYKEWKESQVSEEEVSGLGDVVEKITEATGIKKAVKWIFGEDCGCEERKQALNKLFPFSKSLTEEEFDYLTEFFANKTSKISAQQQKELLSIYNRVFNKKARATSCSKCFLNNIYNTLKKLHEATKF